VTPNQQRRAAREGLAATWRRHEARRRAPRVPTWSEVDDDRLAIDVADAVVTEVARTHEPGNTLDRDVLRHITYAAVLDVLRIERGGAW